MGIVNALCDGRRARSRHQAFGKIEEWGLCSAETAKRLHRKALKEVATKPRAVAIEYPDDAVRVSGAEAQAARARAEELRPYSTIERAIADPERGQVAVRVEGHEAGTPTRDFFLLTGISASIFHAFRWIGYRVWREAERSSSGIARPLLLLAF